MAAKAKVQAAPIRSTPEKAWSEAFEAACARFAAGIGGAPKSDLAGALEALGALRTDPKAKATVDRALEGGIRGLGAKVLAAQLRGLAADSPLRSLGAAELHGDPLALLCARGDWEGARLVAEARGSARGGDADFANSAARCALIGLPGSGEGAAWLAGRCEPGSLSVHALREAMMDGYGRDADFGRLGPFADLGLLGERLEKIDSEDPEENGLGMTLSHGLGALAAQMALAGVAVERPALEAAFGGSAEDGAWAVLLDAAAKAGGDGLLETAAASLAGLGGHRGQRAGFEAERFGQLLEAVSPGRREALAGLCASLVMGGFGELDQWDPEGNEEAFDELDALASRSGPMAGLLARQAGARLAEALGEKAGAKALRGFLPATVAAVEAQEIRRGIGGRAEAGSEAKAKAGGERARPRL